MPSVSAAMGGCDEDTEDDDDDDEEGGEREEGIHTKDRAPSAADVIVAAAIRSISFRDISSLNSLYMLCAVCSKAYRRRDGVAACSSSQRFAAASAHSKPLQNFGGISISCWFRLRKSENLDIKSYSRC